MPSPYLARLDLVIPPTDLLANVFKALVNKETGQPIVLKLFRQPNGARYHFIKVGGQINMSPFLNVFVVSSYCHF